MQFESLFSLPPNSLGYCGKKSATYKFRECIINGKCDGVKKEVGKFIVLYPYLKTISKITGKPKFSKEVIESYWIGNDLLRKAKNKDYEVLLKYLKVQGVPKFFVDELREKKPQKFIPSHLFQVLHIGVGKASGAVPFNLTTINNCMIRFGKIEKIYKTNVTVSLNSLKFTKQKKYKLFLKRGAIQFDSKLTPGLKSGDFVAVHWNMVIKKLNMDELNKLKFWTNEVIKLKF